MNNDNVPIPRHLGLILDGNRRWAKAKGLPVMEGHRRGFSTLKDIVKLVHDKGIDYLSVYAFSTENWQRSADEVRNLMKLFLWIAKHETKELHENGIRFRVIGSRLRLGKSLVKAIHDAEELTKDNTRGTLLVCLDYGGQQEIVEAVKRLAAEGVKPADITVESISAHLYEPDVPPVDLIIRTSGEERISNFMLWRAAYSELIFTPVMWPDFDEAELDRALDVYATRTRRFGK